MRCLDTCCRPERDDLATETVLITYRVSRKERRCAACLGKIMPNEQYRRIFLPPGEGASMTIVEHRSPGCCTWDEF